MSDQAAPIAAPVPARARAQDRNFQVASFRYNRWAFDLDENQTLENCFDPTFWSGLSGKLMGQDKSKGRGDVIEVRKADTGLYAELLVVEIGVGFIKVQVIAKAESVAAVIAENSPLSIKWNPGRKAHDVIRKGDNQVMQGGFQSKTAAADWITKHMAAMAA